MLPKMYALLFSWLKICAEIEIDGKFLTLNCELTPAFFCAAVLGLSLCRDSSLATVDAKSASKVETFSCKECT